MVITIEVANFIVKKFCRHPLHVHLQTFANLGIRDTLISRTISRVLGRTYGHGYNDLITTFGDPRALHTISIHYLVVEIDTSYNVLIGHAALNTLGAIVSTPHLVMKFLSSNGKVVTIKADQKMARQCYVDSLKMGPKPLREDIVLAHIKILTDVELDPRPLIEQGAKPI
ncbi:hypothetical protein CR513_62030, partial [Mucuna pruriens]